MITLNNKHFAENETEFTNSLFAPGGTCAGYAKRLKRHIKLYDHNKELIGVINKHGVLCRAIKTDNGYWYSYGDIKQVGRWRSYLNQCDTIADLAIKRNVKGNYYL